MRECRYCDESVGMSEPYVKWPRSGRQAHLSCYLVEILKGRKDIEPRKIIETWGKDGSEKVK